MVLVASSISVSRELLRVRLSQDHISFICSKSLELFNASEVWIFGSRADISKKGGDIDIFLKTSYTQNILKTKILFLREFEKKFSDQKVDLIVESPNSSCNKIFHIAQAEGINICCN